MSDDRIERRYCAVIQLRDTSVSRLGESVPFILDMIERWSDRDYEQLCRSVTADIFAFVFKTKKPAGMLRAEFEECQGSKHGDSFIVFELGKDCASFGFARPLAWLQHHTAK